MEKNTSAARGNATEDIRQNGLGRLLLLARENFLTRMEQAVADEFDAATFRACSPLLPFVDVTGTRSTEVARRLGVSKQAVGRKIKALVDRGFVACVSDPTDGRAFLVNFTAEGLRFMAEIHAGIRHVERELERELGARKLRAMREGLSEMAYGRKRKPDATAEAPRRSRKTATAAVARAA